MKFKWKIRRFFKNKVLKMYFGIKINVVVRFITPQATAIKINIIVSALLSLLTVSTEIAHSVVYSAEFHVP
jgi:hypothetical protein